MYLYLTSLVILITYYSCEFHSFKKDFVVKIKFRCAANFNLLQGISFLDKNNKHSSIDILEVNEEKHDGIFLIPQGIYQAFQIYIINKNITLTVQKNDLDNKIKWEQRINRKQYFRSTFQRSGSSRIFYYLRYDEMKRWLYEKVNGINFMHIENIGFTEENREILLVKIYKNASKPIIWVDAGIHAREWISPSTALILIDKLLEDSDRSRKLLEKYQFYVMPLINPDGYEYTHIINRLWRKNRARTHVDECKGVDLNRNFPYKWGGSGSSSDPCARVYRGETSASEKETIAITKKLTTIKTDILLFITLHSFGQYIMSPYGYSRNRFPRQYYKLIEMASSVSAHLRENYGRTYQVGSSANLLYEASGASDDYAAGELRIPYTYTIELPDRGRYGFILPPTYIQSVGNQFWDGLYKFTTEID